MTINETTKTPTAMPRVINIGLTSLSFTDHLHLIPLPLVKFAVDHNIPNGAGSVDLSLANDNTDLPIERVAH